MEIYKYAYIYTNICIFCTFLENGKYVLSSYSASGIIPDPGDAKRNRASQGAQFLIRKTNMRQNYSVINLTTAIYPRWHQRRND